MAAMNLQIQLDGDTGPLRARLESWLAQQPSYRDRSPRLEELRYVRGSGSANITLTGRLIIDADSGPPVMRDIVTRLPDADLTPYLDRRLERQARIIGWVADHSNVPVPHVIGADDSGTVVGRPFMMMDRIKGQATVDFPGYNIDGFLVPMAPAERHTLWSSGIDTLCALHRMESPAQDYLDFPGIEGNALPQVLRHWRNSLEWAADALDHRYFSEVMDWLERTQPADAPGGLSWGDARIGNMLFHDRRCVAVLDWEMASLGGPLIDLAWWLLFDRIQDADSGVARLEGLGGRAETINLWEQGTGLSTGHLHWHEVLTNLQLAVTRARAFWYRQRRDMPVPADDDPRSVLRLRHRIDQLLG